MAALAYGIPDPECIHPTEHNHDTTVEEKQRKRKGK
jgi:hypothetical protein